MLLVGEDEEKEGGADTHDEGRWKWKPKDWLCPQITLICMRESESAEERKSFREKSDWWKNKERRRKQVKGFTTPTKVSHTLF